MQLSTHRSTELWLIGLKIMIINYYIEHLRFLFVCLRMRRPLLVSSFFYFRRRLWNIINKCSRPMALYFLFATKLYLWIYICLAIINENFYLCVHAPTMLLTIGCSKCFFFFPGQETLTNKNMYLKWPSEPKSSSFFPSEMIHPRAEELSVAFHLSLLWLQIFMLTQLPFGTWTFSEMFSGTFFCLIWRSIRHGDGTDNTTKHNLIL